MSGGFVSYQFQYRSMVDTPFAEQNLGQHFLTAQWGMVISERIPVRITYSQRQTNSIYFRDYLDVKVELDNSQLNRIQQQGLQQYFSRSIDRWRNTLLRPMMDLAVQRVKGLGNWLNDREVKNRYLDSRLLLSAPSLPDTFNVPVDTLVAQARAFVHFYDEIRERQKRMQQQYDSLQQVYRIQEKRVRTIKNLIAGKSFSRQQIQNLNRELGKEKGRDPYLDRLLNRLNTIRTLAVGRTSPDLGNLSVRNINVTGIDFEYNRNHWIGGVTAGLVSYRFRDFRQGGNSWKNPQYVVALTTGYGDRDLHYLTLTYFQGRKHFIFGDQSRLPSPLRGLSLSGQWRIAPNQFVKASLAQSATPAWINTNGTSTKPDFDFSDRSNRAYSLLIKSFHPHTATRWEGFYQYTGLNFQSFTNFRVNAATESWYVKVDQPVFKKQLRIQALIRKNDFSNPLYPERYEANTIFKSLSMSFRRRKWPTISAGYMPSSQLTRIGQTVYENFYQVFNLHLFHSYKLGQASLVSTLAINRLFNNATDTSFIYYNATSVFTSQHIDFRYFSSDFNVSYTKNEMYRWMVLEAGLSSSAWKGKRIGMGVKVNYLNNDQSGVGLYGQAGIHWNRVGDFNIWIEKNYLPGSGNRLVKNEFYSLGFTRYLK